MNGQTGEPEKEYILYFSDGRVRRVFGRLSEFQKLPVSRIEEAPAAHHPASNIQRDVERLNRALGEGVVRMQDILNPLDILDRVMASFEELGKADVFQLPHMLRGRWPPSGDHYRR